MRLTAYWKAVGAVLAGLVAAGALLPTDAPTWMLALVPVLNGVVVAAFPANKTAVPPPDPPPRGPLSRA